MSGERNIIGIDLGFAGGIAVLKRNATEVYAMPAQKTGKGSKQELDLQGITELLRWFGVLGAHPHLFTAYIEAPQKMSPGHGAQVSTFEQFGMFRGMLYALGVGMESVNPRKWQNAVLGTNIDDTKAASIAKCKALFPGVPLRPTDKCRKDSDGMSDALLIAVYGRRLMNGGS